MKPVRGTTGVREKGRPTGTGTAMSVADGQHPDPAESYTVARQRALRRTLEAYGVLTREHLREAAHARCWSVPFETALQRAVRSGRVRQLSSDLFEPGPKR